MLSDGQAELRVTSPRSLFLNSSSMFEMFAPIPLSVPDALSSAVIASAEDGTLTVTDGDVLTPYLSTPLAAFSAMLFIELPLSLVTKRCANLSVISALGRQRFLMMVAELGS